MATNRKARRQEERHVKGRQAKQTQKGPPGPGSFLSRLSTDWIVGGIILGVVILAAGIYTISRVFSPNAAVDDRGEISQVFSLAVSPVDPKILYLGDGGGLFRSTDGGKKWDRYSITESVQKVYSDPNDPKVLYAGTASGIWKSADSGQTWSRMTTTLPAGTVHSLASDPNDSSKRFASVGSSGLYKSENGGESWVLQNEVPQASLSALAVKPGVPDTVYGFHTIDGFVISVNNGKRFDAIGEGLPRTSVTDLMTIASEPNTLLAAAGRSVYKSTDGGRTWQHSAEGLGSVHIIALGRDAASGKVYASDPEGNVFISSDTGKTWSQNT